MLLGDTKVLTTKGFLPVKEMHKSLECFQSVEGADIVVSKLSHAPVGQYTFKTLNSSKSIVTWTGKLPRPCDVPLSVGNSFDIRKGDVLQALTSDCGYDAGQWASGFMFRHKITSPLNLDPSKYALHNDRLASILKADTQFSTPIDLPLDTATAKERGSFIKGYLAADGVPGRLTTSVPRFFSWFQENAIYAGIIVHGSPQSYRRFIKDRTGKTVFFTDETINWCKGSEFSGFKVVDVTYDEPQKVAYSVSLTEGELLVIDGGWTVYSD